MTGTQDPGECGVAAGNLTTLANPLHRRQALILGEAELDQVQLLPRLDGDGPPPDNPTLREPG